MSRYRLGKNDFSRNVTAKNSYRMESAIELYKWVQAYLLTEDAYRLLDVKDAYEDVVEFGRMMLTKETGTKQWNQLSKQFLTWKLIANEHESNR